MLLCAYRWVLAGIIGLLFVGCFDSTSSGKTMPSKAKRSDYIRAIPGDDQDLPSELIQRGKVLISYSDCYVCHKDDKKLIGPSFVDISSRYPINDVFIDILAQRIILGGSGAWGHSSMSPHPSLLEDDAKAMVSYILSYKNRDLR